MDLDIDKSGRGAKWFCDAAVWLLQALVRRTHGGRSHTRTERSYDTHTRARVHLADNLTHASVRESRDRLPCNVGVVRADYLPDAAIMWI